MPGSIIIPDCGCCGAPIPCGLCLATPVDIPVTISGMGCGLDGITNLAANTPSQGGPACRWSAQLAGYGLILQMGSELGQVFVELFIQQGAKQIIYFLNAPGNPIDCTATYTLVFGNSTNWTCGSPVTVQLN
jgi:hypothetical protein